MIRVVLGLAFISLIVFIVWLLHDIVKLKNKTLKEKEGSSDEDIIENLRISLESVRAFKDTLEAGSYIHSNVSRCDTLLSDLIKFISKNPGRKEELNDVSFYIAPLIEKHINLYNGHSVNKKYSKNSEIIINMVENNTDKISQILNTKLNSLYEADVIDLSAESAVLDAESNKIT